LKKATLLLASAAKNNRGGRGMDHYNRNIASMRRSDTVTSVDLTTSRANHPPETVKSGEKSVVEKNLAAEAPRKARIGSYHRIFEQNHGEA